MVRPERQRVEAPLKTRPRKELLRIRIAWNTFICIAGDTHLEGGNFEGINVEGNNFEGGSLEGGSLEPRSNRRRHSGKQQFQTTSGRYNRHQSHIAEGCHKEGSFNGSAGGVEQNSA